MSIPITTPRTHAPAGTWKKTSWTVTSPAAGIHRAARPVRRGRDDPREPFPHRVGERSRRSGRVIHQAHSPASSPGSFTRSGTGPFHSPRSTSTSRSTTGGRSSGRRRRGRAAAASRSASSIVHTWTWRPRRCAPRTKRSSTSVTGPCRTGTCAAPPPPAVRPRKRSAAIWPAPRPVQTRGPSVARRRIKRRSSNALTHTRCRPFVRLMHRDQGVDRGVRLAVDVEAGVGECARAGPPSAGSAHVRRRAPSTPRTTATAVMMPGRPQVRLRSVS